MHKEGEVGYRRFDKSQKPPDHHKRHRALRKKSREREKRIRKKKLSSRP